MHLIGRWTKAYSYYPHLGTSDGPFMIDHKWNTIDRVKDERWFQTKEGIWHPVVSGGVGNAWRGSLFSGSAIGFLSLSNATITFQREALNSAYVPGTSGDAIGWSFVPTEDVTLDTVYYMVDFYSGTAANVTTIDVELRDDSSNAPDVSGAALQTVVSDPTSFTDRWVTVSGFSTALTAGTRYWICIGDKDTDTVDYANATHTFGATEDSTLYKTSAFFPAARTTDGWNNVAERFAQSPAVHLAFSDGSVIGSHPWSIRSVTASDLNQKGMFYGGGIGTGNPRIVGWHFMTSDNNVNWTDIKIWEGTDGPSGTPFATSVFMTQPRNNNAGFSAGIFSGTHTAGGYPKLAQGTDYRIVAEPSVADRLLNVIMGATDDATLRKGFPGGGNWYQTVESGGAWSDNVSAFIMHGILFDDWEPTIPSSGTGTGRVFPVVPS